MMKIANREIDQNIEKKSFGMQDIKIIKAFMIGILDIESSDNVLKNNVLNQIKMLKY